MENNAYAALNNDTDIRLKSSSGGIFYSLAKKIISDGGIVFGATWNSEWLVDMIHVDNLEDLPKIMTSKYVQANIKNTFKECKDYLDKGIKVLYCTIPCQMWGLKRYLQKEYDNLITIDVCCHGIMPLIIWRDYLKSITRESPIKSINMRDKTNGWKSWSFKIEYEDGYILLESHAENKYVQDFLSDSYLKPSCYNCRFKNENSKADIILGDYWSVDLLHKDLNDDKGISIIITNTKTGDSIIKELNDITLVPTDIDIAKKWNGGMINKTDPSKIKQYTPINIKYTSIITLPLSNNFGGNLQNYALQRVINSLGKIAVTLDIKDYRKIHHSEAFTDFCTKNIRFLTYQNITNFQNDSTRFDNIVVGSDQIWRAEWIYPELSFLDACHDWNCNKIYYAVSSGHDSLNMKQEQLDNIIIPNLNKATAISTREIGLNEYLNNQLNISSSVQCDPTVLLQREDYEKLCSHIEKRSNCFGYYILDEKNFNFDNPRFKDKLKIKPENEYEFLAMFRDADFIITDSYHGCLFSLIFDKPFICIRNIRRGASRFETLIKLFDLNKNIVDTFDNLDYSILDKEPNIDLSKIRLSGLQFLKKNLK